jgi:hypothetical protein
VLAHLGTIAVGWQLVVLCVEDLFDFGASKDVHRVQQGKGLVGKAL